MGTHRPTRTLCFGCLAAMTAVGSSAEAQQEVEFQTLPRVFSPPAIATLPSPTDEESIDAPNGVDWQGVGLGIWVISEREARPRTFLAARFTLTTGSHDLSGYFSFGGAVGRSQVPGWLFLEAGVRARLLGRSDRRPGPRLLRTFSALAGLPTGGAWNPAVRTGCASNTSSIHGYSCGSTRGSRPRGSSLRSTRP